MRRLLPLKQQRGDTIVEVLLAMAVVGMVLGVAFGIANRSVAVGRSAQERSEALKYAETQVELIKEYVANYDYDPGDTATEVLIEELSLTGSQDSACFVVNGDGDPEVQLISDTLNPADNACRYNQFFQVSVACVSGELNADASPVAFGETCDAASPAERKIVVRVSWERFGGGFTTNEDGDQVPVRDNVDLYYRYGG